MVVAIPTTSAMRFYGIDLNANPIAPVLVKTLRMGQQFQRYFLSRSIHDGTPNSRHSYNGEVYVSNLTFI